LLTQVTMTLKTLVILGGAIAGAAYLQNKNRRDRVFTGARDLIDRIKTRAESVGSEVQSKVQSTMEKAGSSVGSMGRNETSHSSSVGANPSGFGGMNPPTYR
jgi:hypothetical protein